MNLTLKVPARGLVLLEFSCLLKLNIVGAISNMRIQFVIDNTPLTSGTDIYVFGYSAETQDIYNSATMRYYINNMTAGSHTISIRAYLDDSASTSWIRNNVLTVMIY